MMLAKMELYRDAHCVIDSLPIPVVQFHLAPQSRAKWSEWGADYVKSTLCIPLNYMGPDFA